MEAKEYLDLLKDENEIIRLAHYVGDHCDGRGYAVVIDQEHNIAVMIQDCGNPNETTIKAGALVKFSTHPESPDSKIVGTPAYVYPGLSHVLWALEKGYAASANWVGDWYPRAECLRMRL